MDKILALCFQFLNSRLYCRSIREFKVNSCCRLWYTSGPLILSKGPILGLIFSLVGRSLLPIYRTQYGRTPIRARMRCGPRPVSPDDYLTARRIDRETST